ncbi:anti-sigma factor antagonist [Streptomyces sp. NPDC001388]|uniref:anti-sigma factor antagonist n=1 Tax=Streptomyces sp. NPDC001388 TaxID=3364568 RepID=UPI0036838611
MSDPAYDANPGTGGATALRITVRPDGDRVVVAVHGELDLDSAERLDQALRAALHATVGGVDLELGEVAFCDCSALNVLLGARELGLRQGKTVVLRSLAPAVARLLDLTGTRPLFADAGPDGPAGGDGGDRESEGVGDGAAYGPDRIPDEALLRDLRVEVVQLRRAMQTRPVIDLARGVLMASFALGAEDAWRVLVEASQHTNTKLHHLAQDVVSAVRGAPPADAVQEQVRAAVARIRAEAPAGAPAGAAAEGAPGTAAHHSADDGIDRCDDRFRRQDLRLSREQS